MSSEKRDVTTPLFRPATAIARAPIATLTPQELLNLCEIVATVKKRRARFADDYRLHKTDEEKRLDLLLARFADD